jgi:hypothetical protein
LWTVVSKWPRRSNRGSSSRPNCWPLRNGIMPKNGEENEYDEFKNFTLNNENYCGNIWNVEAI